MQAEIYFHLTTSSSATPCRLVPGLLNNFKSIPMTQKFTKALIDGVTDFSVEKVAGSFESRVELRLFLILENLIQVDYNSFKLFHSLKEYQCPAYS